MLYKNITGKKLCLLLKRNGWVEDRITGSHHVFKKDGEDAIIVVPVHGNDVIKRGLLKGILKVAKIISIWTFIFGFLDF